MNSTARTATTSATQTSAPALSGGLYQRLTLRALAQMPEIDRVWDGGDIVALDGDEIVFVEVKTRRSERAGTADEAVSPAKQIVRPSRARSRRHPRPAHSRRPLRSRRWI